MSSSSWHHNSTNNDAGVGADTLGPPSRHGQPYHHPQRLALMQQHQHQQYQQRPPNNHRRSNNPERRLKPASSTNNGDPTSSLTWFHPRQHSGQQQPYRRPNGPPPTYHHHHGPRPPLRPSSWQKPQVTEQPAGGKLTQLYLPTGYSGFRNKEECEVYTRQVDADIRHHRGTNPDFPNYYHLVTTLMTWQQVQSYLLIPLTMKKTTTQGTPASVQADSTRRLEGHGSTSVAALLSSSSSSVSSLSRAIERVSKPLELQNRFVGPSSSSTTPTTMTTTRPYWPFHQEVNAGSLGRDGPDGLVEGSRPTTSDTHHHSDGGGVQQDLVTIENTLRYLFFHMRCGIMVTIQDNQLAIFAPFANAQHYRNNWSQHIHVDPFLYRDLGEYYQHKKQFLKRPERILPDVATWWSNGALICNEANDQVWGDSLLPALLHMLVQLCRERPHLPDCTFFLNKRDHPQLKRNLTEPNDHPFPTRNTPLTREKYSCYTPILSFYSGDDFADLMCPSADDWEVATGLVFPRGSDLYTERQRKEAVDWFHNSTECLQQRFFVQQNIVSAAVRRLNREKKHKHQPPPPSSETTSQEGQVGLKAAETQAEVEVVKVDAASKEAKAKAEPLEQRHEQDHFYNDKVIEWEDKIPTCIFRGGATGAGTTSRDNPRILAAELSLRWSQDPRYRTGNDTDGVAYLDASVTAWNFRDKKVVGQPMRFTALTEASPPLGTFIPVARQAAYKYVLYIPGHSASSRYSYLMTMGSVIFKVEANPELCDAPKLWFFDRLLKPWVDHVPVAHDLSNLAERIEWAKTHDKECEAIAECAKQLHAKYLCVDGILDYWQFLLQSVFGRQHQPA